MRSDKKQKKSKRWLKITGIVLLLFVIGVGAYVYSIYHSLTNAVDTMHQPIEREKFEKRAETITLTEQEPFSVLLLGVDEREGDRGRSDTMVVLTVNEKQNSIKMLSIPRDTRTEIANHGTTDKINHAYAFGGEEMSIATVENLLDIPIDYYVRINMEGFMDIVDAVGGIQVQNNLAFSNDGYDFASGNIHLNGDQALSYVTMRYDDPKGDFGRQERQRQVIQGVISKGASFSSITRFHDIFGALGRNIRTDLTFDEMYNIQKNYRSTVGTIDQLQLTGDGKKINGIYYQILSDEELQKVQKELQSHLEI